MVEDIYKILVPSISAIIIAIATSIITAIITVNGERRKITTTEFKNKGADNQKNLLDVWSSVLLDPESFVPKVKKIFKENILNKNKEIKNISDKEIYTILMENTYIYSSKNTMRVVSYYMQHIFGKYKDNTTAGIFYVSKICAKLKYDFTGEKVSFITIILIKVNDLSIKQKTIFYSMNIFYKIPIYGLCIVGKIGRPKKKEVNQSTNEILEDKIVI